MFLPEASQVQAPEESSYHAGGASCEEIKVQQGDADANQPSNSSPHELQSTSASNLSLNTTTDATSPPMQIASSPRKANPSRGTPRETSTASIRRSKDTPRKYPKEWTNGWFEACAKMGILPGKVLAFVVLVIGNFGITPLWWPQMSCWKSLRRLFGVRERLQPSSPCAKHTMKRNAR